jgi:hypothetical protein
MLSETAFSPISTLLRDRKFGLLLAGAAVSHIGLLSLGLPSWECPLFKLTGIPCPGCGLTRACLLLLRGEVLASIKFHAFAPVFVVLISILMIGTVLPKALVAPLVHKAETLERQTGLTIIILGGLILYWLARLLLFPTAFARLIRG